MPIFKLTDPGAEVTYTLWHFDVDAFLKQYDEASMHPHIFPVSTGTQVNGPAPWMKAKISLCRLADEHGKDVW